MTLSTGDFLVVGEGEVQVRMTGSWREGKSLPQRLSGVCVCVW